MKDKENTVTMSKRKKIVYSVILAVCVLLIVAATVLTVYFVTNSGSEVLEEPPAGGPDEPSGPSEPEGPGEPSGPSEPEGPGEPSGPSEPEGPGEPSGGEGRVAFVSPVEAAVCTVAYYEIYNNATLDNWTRHLAMDFAADEGSAVCAMSDGTVVGISLDDVLGNLVEIAHEGGITTVYRFVDPVETLRVGDTVKQGQKIAEISAACGTEEKDGAHLHLEMKAGGKYVDPADYIDKTFEEK